MGLGATIILVIFGGYNFWIEAQNGLGETSEKKDAIIAKLIRVISKK